MGLAGVLAGAVDWGWLGEEEGAEGIAEEAVVGEAAAAVGEVVAAAREILEVTEWLGLGHACLMCRLSRLNRQVIVLGLDLATCVPLAFMALACFGTSFLHQGFF